MAVDLRDLTPAEWAFVIVLLLLAMAGIYYLYTLCCGYRCLPLKTTDCPGGEPNFNARKTRNCHCRNRQEKRPL